jgi:mono/diheme cytochrome c family protein
LTAQPRHSAQPVIRTGSIMRLILTSIVFTLFFIGHTWGQPGALNAEDVQKGHELAIHICAICHVAAPDQPYQPIRRPPAPSFAAIARQKAFHADSLTHFMKTTHQGLDNPQAMSNPDLMDYQIKQIVAYFLSLYK